MANRNSPRLTPRPSFEIEVPARRNTDSPRPSLEGNRPPTNFSRPYQTTPQGPEQHTGPFRVGTVRMDKRRSLSKDRVSGRPPAAGPAQPRYYAQPQNTAATNSAAADVPAYEQWTLGTDFTALLKPGKVVGVTSWSQGVLTFPGGQAPPIQDMAKLKTSLAELARKHKAKTYVQCTFRVSDRRYRHDKDKQIVGIYITAWNAFSVQSD